MFNGYNETPLLSYEFNQERAEKKHENVPKWPYGHEGVGVQPGQAQPNNRHLEFWSGKSNFLGIPNVVKCNCTGCYPSTQKQSYQGDTRHRPWLPRTFPVPVNGTNEPCKLPGYQWDNGLPNQGRCYPEGNLSYMQENGRKYSYYNHSRFAEPIQPGVITSVKNTEKQKTEMPSQESPVLNGVRHPPVFCNPGYSLPPKRADGRNYCDVLEKYSNVGSYAVDQHVGRLPVVEPFAKSVPSNINQSRVPSTAYRNVKENVPQACDLGYGDGRKMCTEPSNEKIFSSGPPQHEEYSHYKRECIETEMQKLFFENARHPDYYTRSNFQDVIKRNNQALENRKDCIVSQITEQQHYDIPRLKYQEMGNSKPGDAFYSGKETLLAESSGCFQRNEDDKNERMPPSAFFLNDPRFAERSQNSFTYQSSPVAYRNYLSREYQGYNAKSRYEYPAGVQRNDLTHCRGQQMQQQECQQLTPQLGSGYPLDSQSPKPEKSQQLYSGKNVQFFQADLPISENGNATYLESMKGEKLNKNERANKISPLRLLRKKKFVNVPQDTAPVSSLNAVPGLDVRKFWSTWAEEEEENVAPAQVVVLDCQNIDPEEAKLLQLYETDPIRAVPLDTNAATNLKNSEEKIHYEEVKVCEPKIEEHPIETEVFAVQQEEKPKENISVDQETTSNKHFSEEKSEKKKSEAMDKWTEKKFDFLKRAEESKAAEILRHEEEKKKIFERRVSLQQALKKPEDKKGEESEPLEGGISKDESQLPTSEYRRNKFLDYSPGKTVSSEEDRKRIEKEEKVNLQEIKQESGYEMDDILKRISEMNVQCPEIKLKENRGKRVKSEKKQKRKKLDQQNENDERTNKLTVETATTVKPTIKFSIQKSHDLKISFKVLNNSKEYEDMRSEDAYDAEKDVEENKNSTELITLKYKSIQRDGDGSESKKSKRHKKRSAKTKSPVLKFKKSRYSPEEEDKDPLAVDDDPLNVSKKGYCDTSDGFQVLETMDSAKIKLTFKRHKGNFETEYKINSSSSNMEKMSEVDRLMEEDNEKSTEISMRSRRKSWSDENYAEAGVDIFPFCSEISESNSEMQKTLSEPLLEDDSRNSSSSRSFVSEHIKCEFQLEPSTFSEFPSNIENGTSDEARKCDEELEELMLINCGKGTLLENKQEESPCVDTIESEPMGSSVLRRSQTSEEEEEKKIQKVSLDFISSSKSIDENVECSAEPLMEKKVENLQSSYKFKFEKENEKEEVPCTKGISLNSPPDLLLESENNKCSETISGPTESTAKEETTSGLPILLQTKDDLKKIDLSSVEENLSAGKTAQDSGSPTEEKLCDSETKKTKEIEFEKAVDAESEEGRCTTNCEVLLENIEENPSKSDVEGCLKVSENFGTSLSDESRKLTKESEKNDLRPIVNCEIAEKLCDEDVWTRINKKFENPEISKSISSNLGENIKECIKVDFVSMDSKTSEKSVEDVWKPINGDSVLENPETVSKLLEDSKKDFVEIENSRTIEKSFQDVWISIKGSEKCEKPEAILQESENVSTESKKNAIEKYEKIDFAPVEEYDVWSPTVRDANLEISQIIPEDQKNVSTGRPDTMEPEKEDSVPEVRNISIQSPTPSALESWSLNHLGEDSGCAECSFSTDEPPPSEIIREGTPLHSDVELEDGEILDNCEKTEETEEPQAYMSSTRFDFLTRKIERRHSINPGRLIESQRWQNKKFCKAGSCPPELKFPKHELEAQEISEDIPIESIPLPLGPPQENNCYAFRKYLEKNIAEELMDRSKESRSPERLEISAPCQPNMGSTQVENRSLHDREAGLFQRSSKIKFSFLKRSKHSKFSFKSPPQTKNDIPKVEEAHIVVNKPTVYDQEKLDSNEPKECVKEENVTEEQKNDYEGTKEFDGLENVDEVSMSDFIRDEFYECEDIPTSEDLTNGEDLDSGKVNDDKFRNIMQNCLDNAKKFLNVGNLKLFSCSVDDLLELDDQESTEGKSMVGHISRDVLLTSCEDTNDDLGLCESIPPADISMDFVPSFCTDACPEILPVDNWPYLEEEVPSSPTIIKSEETDLIATLDDPQSEDSHETKRFRRKSLLSNLEPVRSKVKRRNTIDRVGGMPCRDIRILKKDLIRWRKKIGVADKSLKCQLSLDKIEKNGKTEKKVDLENENNLNYKSATWQPKVMLFRISKNELRNVLESPKIKRRLSPIHCDSLKKSVTSEPKDERNVKSEKEVTSEPLGTEKSIDLLKLNTIKGSLRAPDMKKPKKSRFRNLHGKRKQEPKISVPSCSNPSEIFQECYSETKNAKVVLDDGKLIRKDENSLNEERRCQKRTKEEWRKEKKHEHLEERREKSEVKDQRKRKDRKHERRGSSHDRRSHEGKNSPKRLKKEEELWVCEVCGFKEANERVVHIKSHPFHCQSCHLAFKTEAHFVSHLRKNHKDIRNQHHCLLCELSFDTEDEYHEHLETREHRHLESVEKNTINTLFTLLTGAPCPVFGLVEMKPEWLPNQAGTVHFYHQATPLSLALQYLKMHHDLLPFSTASSTLPN